MTKIKHISNHSVNDYKNQEAPRRGARSAKSPSVPALQIEQSIKGERETQASYVKNKLLNTETARAFSAQSAGVGKQNTPPADTVYDGLYVGAGGKTYPPQTPLARIPPVEPQTRADGLTKDGVKPNKETLIYINGIDTDLAYQTEDIRNIANKTGSRVLGIHNSTDDSAGDIPGLGVPWADVRQSADDKLGIGNNPAVTTLAKTIYGELKAGRPVHLIGESQGAIITSRALGEVKKQLEADYLKAYAAGSRKPPFPRSTNWDNARYEAELALSRVKVETFGGAAATYPDGPQYVHYINRKDPVASRLGPNSGMGLLAGSAGRGAVIREFDYGTGGFDSHILRQAYLPQRIPFDQARLNAPSHLPPDPPVVPEPAPTPELDKPLPPPTEEPTATNPSPAPPPTPGTGPVRN